MGDSGRVGESGLLVTATARASTAGLTKSLAKELARHGIRAIDPMIAARAGMMMRGNVISVSTRPPTIGADCGRPAKLMK